MPIFDRLRRHRPSAPAAAMQGFALTHIPLEQLPPVNHRVSVTTGAHVPVPSRVEDVEPGALVIAAPALPLEAGDQVVVNWELDGAWFTLNTRVTSVDEHALVPVVQLATDGHLRRHDERRSGDERFAVDLGVDAKIVSARAIRAGRELQVRTIEVGRGAIRFATSAPFAPDDVVEVSIALGAGVTDVVHARTRVIRVDSVSGSWRSTVTVTFEEILRSDRARLLATAASLTPKPLADASLLTPMTPPPTADGVGGYDSPVRLDTLDAAVEWLRRKG